MRTVAMIPWAIMLVWLAFLLRYQLPDPPVPEAKPRFLEPPSYHIPFPCEEYGCPVMAYEMDDPFLQSMLERQGREGNFWLPFSTPSSALLTRRSNQRDHNQDKAVIVDLWGEAVLAAVLDGHGDEGHVVAAFVQEELPRRLADRLRRGSWEKDWVSRQLEEVLVELDVDAPAPSALRGGCTATMIIQRFNTIWFANLGDSRSILVSQTDSGPQIVHSTRRDKAHLPDELARIESMGGKVHIPPSNPMGSRVVVYSVAAAHHEMIGLAMSRSIGDWEWGADGVIAQPIVDVLDLSAYEKPYVILASDGLWDLRKPEFYANHLQAAFDKPALAPLQILVDLFLEVAPREARWYRDDMTCIVLRVGG